MYLKGFVAEKLAFPMLMRYAKSPSMTWYKDLIHHDRSDREALKQRQWEKLKTTISEAIDNVPYYRDSFRKADFNVRELTNPEDLLSLPTIDKKQIAANFPDRMTSQASDTASWQYFATSGTTNRLMVIKDAEAISRNLALSHYEEFLQGKKATGRLCVTIPPDACSLACGLAVKPPQDFMGRLHQTFKKLGERHDSTLARSLGGKVLRKLVYPVKEMPSFGPSGTRMDADTLDWYVDKVCQWQPEVLAGLPTYLQLLARHIKRSGRQPPRIGSIQPQGGLTTPGMKKEIQDVFGVPIHEVYGGHEFGCIASTCKALNKMHVLTSECFVEVLRGNRHALNGELGEIVLTVFSNTAMPLIRYRPGDVGRMFEPGCPCGRHTPLLRVEGRIQDAIVIPGAVFSAREIIDFYGGIPNIEFAQLVQRNENRCDLLIVETEKGKTDLERLGTASAEFFNARLQVRPRIVSTIKPEASGKFRFVKSASFENFHQDSDRAMG